MKNVVADLFLTVDYYNNDWCMGTPSNFTLFFFSVSSMPEAKK